MDKLQIDRELLKIKSCELSGFSNVCTIYSDFSNTGTLKGLKFSLKDNIVVKNIITTAGSLLLSNYTPIFSSTVYKLLVKNGALFLGKNILEQFAVGTLGINTIYKKYNLEPRLFGGSSTGCGISVEKNLVDFSIGTDTGGSVRVPAGFNRLYGYKPTYGLISRNGVIPLSNTLDTIGIISKNIKTIVRVCKVLFKKDCNDMTNIVDLKFNLQIKNILVLDTFFKEIRDKELLKKYYEIIEKLSSKYKVVLDKDILLKKSLILEKYFSVVGPEFFSAMNRYDGFKFNDSKIPTLKTRDGFFARRNNLIQKSVLNRIDIGYNTLLKLDNILLGFEQYYKKLISEFSKFDIIIVPGVIMRNWKNKDYKLQILLLDAIMAIPNLLKIPAIITPCGLQILGNQNYDFKLLNFIENEKEWLGKNL